MARLKPLTLSVLGEPFDFPIILNNKTGVFSTEYPPSVWKRVAVQYEFKTLDELKAAIHEAVRAANAQVTIIEDWIFYEFTHTPDYSLHKSERLNVRFVALRNIRCGKDSAYKVIGKDPWGDDNEDGLPKGFRVQQNEYGGYPQMNLSHSQKVPFSPEAYKFFEDMLEATKELAKRLEAFATPEMVIQMATKNQLPAFFDPAQATTTPTT